MLRNSLKTKSGTELWLQVRKQRNANLVNPKRVLTTKWQTVSVDKGGTHKRIDKKQL